MKSLTKIFAVLALMAATQKVSAQTAFKNIAVINSTDFQDEKQGVKKIAAVYTQMAKEFSFQSDEINKLQTRYNQLTSEISQAPKNVDVLKKKDELEKLTNDYQSKSEALKAAYERRSSILLAPIYDKVSKLYETWCKQKGFIVVIDLAKDTNGLISWVDQNAVNALTNELIQYLNTSL